MDYGIDYAIGIVPGRVSSTNNSFVNITLHNPVNGSLLINSTGNEMFQQFFSNVTFPTFVLFENGNGSINFTAGINFTALINLSKVLAIDNNSIFVNSSNDPSILVPKSLDRHVFDD